MICVLTWGACSPPRAGGRCGRGSPPPAMGIRGYYHGENLDILPKKSCIFVHICMPLDMYTVMVIGNKRYSHFNAQKHETTGQNICGGGAEWEFAMMSPTKLFGDMHPSPVSAPTSPPSRLSFLSASVSSITQKLLDRFSQNLV